MSNRQETEASELFLRSLPHQAGRAGPPRQANSGFFGSLRQGSSLSEVWGS